MDGKHERVKDLSVVGIEWAVDENVLRVPPVAVLRRESAEQSNDRNRAAFASWRPDFHASGLDGMPKDNENSSCRLNMA
jgi:hypothetical protein